MLSDTIRASAEQTINENRDKVLFIIFLPRRAMMARRNRFMLAFFCLFEWCGEKNSIYRREDMVSVRKKLSEFIVLCEENNFSCLLLLLWNRVTKNKYYFLVILWNPHISRRKIESVSFKSKFCGSSPTPFLINIATKASTGTFL
jgi:hypothetical protein